MWNMGLVALQQTYENNSISISFGLLLLVWLKPPTWAYLGPSCSGASSPWGFWEGQRIARPSGLQPQWHHGSSLGSRWMGGRRGVMGGSFGFFTRRWGKKNRHFPMAEWNGLVLFFVPWQRVSWVIELGRLGDAMGPAIVGSMRAFYKTLDIGPERWLLEDFLYLPTLWFQVLCQFPGLSSGTTLRNKLSRS